MASHALPMNTSQHQPVQSEVEVCRRALAFSQMPCVFRLSCSDGLRACPSLIVAVVRRYPPLPDTFTKTEDMRRLGATNAVDSCQSLK